MRRPAQTTMLLVAVALGQFIAAIDYNIVYVALPRIGAQMHLGAHDLQWVVSAFAVAYGGLLLFGGRATDALGRFRVFRTALLVFGAGSALSAVAPSNSWLIAGRVVQGLAAAMMTPAMLAVVHTDFAAGAPRNRALALWSGAGAAGLASGSLLGGLLTQAFGWRAVFAVNVVLVIATLLISLRASVATGSRRPVSELSGIGALVATGSIGALVYALVEGPASGWGSTQTVVALGLTAGLAATFVVAERRSATPLLPAGLLGQRTLLVAMAVTFVFMASFGTEYYLFTIYFQNVLGYDVLGAGLSFLPAAILCVAATQVAGRLLGRIGAPWTLVLGLASGAAGMLAIGVGMGVGRPYVAVLPGIALLSLGQGLAFTAMFAAVGSALPPAQQGTAAALASTTLQIGSAVGLALLVAVADAPIHAGGNVTASEMVVGLRHATDGAAIIALIGVALATTLLRHGSPSTVSPRRATSMAE